MRYIRVLPIMIITAFALLSFRVHNIWQKANVNKIETVKATTTQVVASNNVANQNQKKTKESKSASLIDFNSAMADDSKTKKPAMSKSKQMENEDPQFMSEEEITVLTKLSERRRQLDKRSLELDRKEKFMSAAELRINSKIQQMKKLEKSINAKIKEADAKHQKDIKSLVKVYEGMKAEDAAKIFEDLEPDVLLALVENMKQKNLALILSSMNPVKARDITVELARKKQLVDFNK